jgi:hypothetical protein
MGLYQHPKQIFIVLFRSRMDKVRTPSSTAGRSTVHTVPAPTLVDTFGESIHTLLERYRAARMPFFGRFAALPREVASNPSLLGQIHLNYQSVMHATRAARAFAEGRTVEVGKIIYRAP